MEVKSRMRNGTFCMFQADTIPSKKISTEPVPIWRAGVWPDKTNTSMELGHLPGCGVYESGLVIHKREKSYGDDSGIKWTWHGKNITKLVETISFPVYFIRAKNLLIARCDRDSSCEALAALCKKKTPARLSISPLEIDLRKVKDHLTKKRYKHASINGLWVKQKRGKTIKSQAAFGQRVTRNRSLSRACSTGSISNLSLYWPRKPRNVRANISSSGSVFFITYHELDECLGFLEYLFDNFT
jgi:hypothetical protein